MFYYTLRPYVTFILRFFIKRRHNSGLDNIPESGAVLLASTHGNSFFDAVLLACTLDRRIWSLARGDVFRKPWARKILTSLFMMPMHRLSEGKEHVGDNDATFKQCIDLFAKGEIVLIFTEGICTNQTKLLPLKKGAGRLAQKAWEDNMQLTVLPVGIRYDTYYKFGKIINLTIGNAIEKADFQELKGEGFFLKAFNNTLSEKLTAILNLPLPKASFWKNPLFYIGQIINFPANLLCIALSRKLTKGTVFFDSITLGIMIVVLPVYWILLGFLIGFLA